MAQTTPQKIDRRLLWIGAIVLLVAVFYTARVMTRERLPVRAAEVHREDLISSLPTNGKVEPQINFEAHSPFATTVKDIFVHEGDKVPAGKLLIVLDDADARSRIAATAAAVKGAQANYDTLSKGGTQEERLSLSSELSKAKIEHDQAVHDLAALQKLQLTGAASASEVRSAQLRVDAANAALQSLQERKGARYSSADVEHARAALAEAQIAYSGAQELIARTNVRAKFAGTVYSLPVSRTEFVDAGKLLLQLADLTRIQIRAYFDEPEIGKLAIGQPIKVVWDAKPGRAWHGHVTHVPSTIINYGTRNVGEVLVTVDDSDGTLIPNTNVIVTVTTSHKENVLTVPREALHTENGESFVYKIVNNVLQRTPIKVGTLNLTQVEVVSGLNEHDVVSLGTTNGQSLSGDAPVKIVK